MNKSTGPDEMHPQVLRIKWLSCYLSYLRSHGIDHTLSKLVKSTKMCGAVSSPSRGCPGFSQEIIFRCSCEGADPGAVWLCLCCYSIPLISLPAD